MRNNLEIQRQMTIEVLLRSLENLNKTRILSQETSDLLLELVEKEYSDDNKVNKDRHLN